ncbi:MAG: pseudouridine synthase [Pirellula sp.]|nr:pseudouridine synthase [Pirellula sp.]
MSKPKRTTDATPSFLSGEQRINKLLAAAGLGSRRQVDELITEGRVEIDGKVISQVGIKVDADKAKILVDGEPLKRHRPVYYAVHKPAGVLCTNSDPEGRPRVIDLVPAQARLFPVGRLDASSTGLILLTNDGELAQRLAHPKHCVPKTYFVVVAGQVEKEAMRRLQRGIYLAEGVARVDGATIRKVRKGCTEIDITLSEGKNREIRRVLARLGHKVVVLRRTSIGPLKLADMPEGAHRPLQDREVAALYQAVEEIKRARNQDRRERKKRNTENELASGTPKAGKPPASGKSRPPVFDEDGGDWNEEDEFEADSIMDTLPPMSKNPFRTADDEADGEEGFDDAILVSDFNAPEVYSNKRGAVLSYEDEDGLNDFGDEGFEEMLESDEDESEDATSSPRRPRGRNGSDRRPSSRGRGDRAPRERAGREGDSPYQRGAASTGQGSPRYGQRSRSADGPGDRRRPGPEGAGRGPSRGARGRGGPGGASRGGSSGSPYASRSASGDSRPEFGAGEDRPRVGTGRRPPRTGGSSPYGTRRGPGGPSRPTRGPSGDGRPARGPVGDGRPARGPSGEGRPARGPSGEGRPSRGPARGGRPGGKPGGKRFGGSGGGKPFAKKRRP